MKSPWKAVIRFAYNSLVSKFPLAFDKMSEPKRNYSIDIGGMRIKYNSKEDVFTEKHLIAREPFPQFQKWFNEACCTPEILEPNAMCLSTCTR